MTNPLKTTLDAALRWKLALLGFAESEKDDAGDVPLGQLWAKLGKGPRWASDRGLEPVVTYCRKQGSRYVSNLEELSDMFWVLGFHNELIAEYLQCGITRLSLWVFHLLL
jgi:hypothetical protein